MKKTPLVLLALLAAAMLCFGAMAEATDYTGKWVLTGVEMNGTRVSNTMLGLEMSLTLNADGTCLYETADDAQPGTWAATETGITVTDEGGAQDLFTYGEDMLSIVQSGVTLLMTREGAEPAIAAPKQYVKGTPRTGLTLADFNGRWVLVGAETGGMFLTPDMVGMSLQIDLADGAGEYHVQTASSRGSIDLACEVTEQENGTLLTATVMDSEKKTLPFMLYDSGLLIWDASTDAMELYYYLELAPADAE